MELSKIASAIYNDVKSGLAGMNAEETMSLEQIEDEVVECRQAVIKELYLKNALDKKDLMVSINCVDVDCDDMNKCPCKDLPPKMAKHFEIPRLIEGLGEDAVMYVGSTDRAVPFKVYYTPASLKFAKYKRNAGKPYVYIERTPNENNKYDGWVFNAPFIDTIAVIGIFQDLRQLEDYNCCNTPDFTDFGSVSILVKDRLTKQKLQYYRQYLMPPHANDLIPR